MRFEIRAKSPEGYVCGDPDDPDGFQELGSGATPMEALGEAVREVYLTSDHGPVISDISENIDQPHHLHCRRSNGGVVLHVVAVEGDMRVEALCGYAPGGGTRGRWVEEDVLEKVTCATCKERLKVESTSKDA